MIIPDGFQFSSSSLQDFEDCRYRFWLRYLQHIDWPAVISEPALESERRMLLGGQFHRLVQAYFCGLPTEQLSASIQDSELAGWWAGFVEWAPGALPTPGTPGYFTELQLSAALKGYRLLAKLDLVCRFPDGSWRIFDWKTNRKRPARKWLSRRLQTRLYPYLLVRSSPAVSTDQFIPADSIQMTYWYPAFPDQPEEFPYSQAQFEMDEAYLSGLLSVILKLDDDEFEKTSQLDLCSYCVYRSLCDRGTSAGLDEAGPSEVQDAPELELDFDQIAEIRY